LLTNRVHFLYSNENDFCCYILYHEIMTDFEKLGLYIKKKRLATGLGLNQFCIEYEISSNTLSQYENNKREPKISKLEKIAKAFNQTLIEFLTDFEKELPNL